MSTPLHVAFVWHMHQPYYRNAVSGEHRLPWVRLHATKDYLHMAEVLEAHPTIHQTFNFVPSLVEQLVEYATGEATDPWLRLSTKAALDEDDKRFLLKGFFAINADRFINRIPRYAQLSRLREPATEDVGLLSDAYWRDLIAWFNLAWIDPEHIAADPQLANLAAKGRDFTRADIDLILAKHRVICSMVVPAYRRLQAAGQVELSTSPYFHPILPALVDAASAREATPQMTLPRTPFASPEDAAEQIRRAYAYHTDVFGRPPAGLWPSEGAVSQPVVEMVAARKDLRWLATDEAILGRSLGIGFPRDGAGHLLDPGRLCQPYRAGGDPGVALIFRDNALSDRIGFIYSQWRPEDAAADLIGRLEVIADRLASDRQPHLLSIILDGENCWEFYQNNGSDFLHRLYAAFERSPKLRTVTVAEYLDEHPPRARLERVAAGSWIFGNLETWIGEPDQNRAWDYLALARNRITTWQRDTAPEDVSSLETVWRLLYTCEGSDWFWWYYSRNRQGQGGEFDAEFRSHLASIYTAIGQPHPDWLDQAIAGPPPERSQSASGYLTAPPDAADATPAGWAVSGYVEPDISSGAMQRASSLVRRWWFGYNPHELGFRLEASGALAGHSLAFYISIAPAGAGNAHIRHWTTNAALESHGILLEREVLVDVGAASATLSAARGDDSWLAGSRLPVTVGERVIDVRVPLASLGIALGARLGLLLAIVRDDALVEVVPGRGTAELCLESR